MDDLPAATEPPPAPVAPADRPLLVTSPDTARFEWPAIHPEGRKFVAIAVGIVLLLGPILHWAALAWLMAGVTVWVAAFFRDPVRITPQAGATGDTAIISPADGLISQIVAAVPPRQLLGDGGLEPEARTRISVFMSVFDVHVNRSPAGGRLTRIIYVPGKFLNADLDKASDDNERQYFVVETATGERIAFTQIAGLVARRIMRFVETGQTVAAGERIGLIRFGSRVDVWLPIGYQPQVVVGQRAIAGETVLARSDAAAVTLGVAQ